MFSLQGWDGPATFSPPSSCSVTADAARRRPVGPCSAHEADPRDLNEDGIVGERVRHAHPNRGRDDRAAAQSQAVSRVDDPRENLVRVLSCLHLKTIQQDARHLLSFPGAGRPAPAGTTLMKDSNLHAAPDCGNSEM